MRVCVSGCISVCVWSVCFVFRSCIISHQSTSTRQISVASTIDPLPSLVVALRPPCLNLRPYRTPRREWSLTAAKQPHYPLGDSNNFATTRAVAASDSGWGGSLIPPRWVPDEESIACSGCGKDFDWARRRVRWGWIWGAEGDRDPRDAGPSL